MKVRTGSLKAYCFSKNELLSSMASVLSIRNDVVGEIIHSINNTWMFLFICLWHLAMKQHMYKIIYIKSKL